MFPQNKSHLHRCFFWTDDVLRAGHWVVLALREWQPGSCCKDASRRWWVLIPSCDGRMVSQTPSASHDVKGFAMLTLL